MVFFLISVGRFLIFSKCNLIYLVGFSGIFSKAWVILFLIQIVLTIIESWSELCKFTNSDFEFFFRLNGATYIMSS